MSAEIVQHLLHALDQAFEGDRSHSLLSNLGSVGPDDWRWTPPGGHRSIRDMVQHVGGCKLMYENHAFGDRTLTWADPRVDGIGALESISGAIAWLREGQRVLRQSIAALDDAELARPRRTNWGDMKETRWIIMTMIQHDLFHAGEINHLRALRQRDDRWAYDSEDVAHDSGV
jgi:hypothetical protein